MRGKIWRRGSKPLSSKRGVEQTYIAGRGTVRVQMVYVCEKHYRRRPDADQNPTSSRPAPGATDSVVGGAVTSGCRSNVRRTTTDRRYTLALSRDACRSGDPHYTLKRNVETCLNQAIYLGFRARWYVLARPDRAETLLSRRGPPRLIGACAAC